ncbi:mannitol repressor protein [Klebsiella sp. WP7-S18-CRE-02]|uniref:MltR family transcriptional regulator n=2 Tax=Enterobacterales TaxID=91347 RepID=A0A2T2Y6K1_9ENTR|nr:MltR family transcriptional regulator [Kluyvera genomosp. 2]BBQ84759.1 mannitol repressor protein [Klebsiella sp. WP3-W18-ESBL-02]BBR21809.1 mannitol repressor protein [Klebsiella sp. WP3-S18-ESBL-05]BBR58080.1 mannitol repressor protein [Klebsiella sp. WP4-W18-ESBL-05]BBS92668.1 mannitol repressor protein [Klebsiella sp. WP7-S18-CRE-02]BBS97697.1 mannitol repressor protein [Klebsiella sp. WP7-S18-CRE-03]BBT02764.1 mannitol repressor protein [Klebsiella sp. WP7-S18-ESBL-04]BBT71958.1 mann
MKLNRLRMNAQPESEKPHPKDSAPEKPPFAKSNATMMAPMDDAHLNQNQAVENRILERLNARQTLTGFIQTAVGLLSEAVDQLILQAFRKDDYAVKYAVEPLLEGSGPLANLPVRLKLIYALGVISRDEYEDVELLLALNNELAHENKIYSFTDDEILGPINMLHCMTALPPPPTLHLPEDVVDDALRTMQEQRYQQMVRSTLVLSITDLVTSLAHKKAF